MSDPLNGHAAAAAAPPAASANVSPLPANGPSNGSAALTEAPVSHSVVAECAEAFRMLCDGNAGKGLNTKDLYDLMHANGLHPTEEDVGELVRAIDQQGNGVVTLNEFTVLMLQGIEPDDLEYMRVAFAEHDPTGGGVITAAQFMELLASNGECSNPDEVHEKLMFADPEMSGRVNYERFLQTVAMRLR